MKDRKALNYFLEDILKQLAEIRTYILKRGNKTDRAFRKVWDAIEKLSSSDTKKKGQIGFSIDQK